MWVLLLLLSAMPGPVQAQTAEPQPDADADGVPDALDACPGADDRLDADGDGVPDGCDENSLDGPAADADGDGVLNADDQCPGSDDALDADGDGIPNGCDEDPTDGPLADADGDGVPNGSDVCSAGDDSLDQDADGIPDACDGNPSDGPAADADGDGVSNADDLCALGDDALDADGDGTPDACDADPQDGPLADPDGDGVPNSTDACPSGDDRIDVDADGVADGCDADLTDGPAGDSDADGVVNADDVCATGPDSDDADGDGVPDACDRDDTDGPLGDPDGDGSQNANETLAGSDPYDAASVPEDVDADGVLNAADNCAALANADQADLDDDGLGDACDADADGDDYLVTNIYDVLNNDCNNLNASIHPGVFDRQDGVDNDCDRVTDEAIIGNGVVQLGITPKGNLNVPGGTASSGTGTTYVGLRYVPTNAASTEPGCVCEGWGAADASLGVSGWANEASGTSNILVESFVYDEDSATSTVLIRRDGVPHLRVVHDYHPSTETPNLYEVSVRIQNLAATDAELLYRRVMDWDVEPTAFNEFVTLLRGSAEELVATTNDGFDTADPLSSPSDMGYVGNFLDAGPDDHGALFQFDFGTLEAGHNKTFLTFYGAAGNQTGAYQALADVGAEAFSFGQPSLVSGDISAKDSGAPNTFIFAFGAVGGEGFELGSPELVSLDRYIVLPGGLVRARGNHLNFLHRVELVFGELRLDADWRALNDREILIAVPENVEYGLGYNISVTSELGADTYCCVSIEAPRLSRIEITPDIAVLGAGQTINLSALGFDQIGQDFPLDGVDWSIDPSSEDPGLGALNATGPLDASFTTGASTGSARIIASSGNVSGASLLLVSLLTAANGTTTTVEAAVVRGEVGSVENTKLVVGLAIVEEGATIRLASTPTDPDSDFLTGADIGFDAADEAIALEITTQLGDASIVPSEVDPETLFDTIEDLSPASEPAIFIQIQGTRAGADLTSEELRTLLGTVRLEFRVPVAYFTANGLDPNAVRLIEFSDGVLVTTDIEATLLGASGGFYRYEAVIDNFSAFAIIGGALSSSGATGRGGGADGELLESDLSYKYETSDAVVSALELSFSAGTSVAALGRPKIFTYEPAVLPEGVPVAPPNVTVIRYIDVSYNPMLAAVQEARFTLTFNASGLDHPDHGVILHLKEGVWVPEAPIRILSRDGDTLRAEVVTTCCSFFAVVFDDVAPTLLLDVPGGELSGVLMARVEVQDNLGAHRVEFALDGTILATDAQAPFELVLDTAAHPGGDHVLSARVFDHAGNEANETRNVAFAASLANPNGSDDASARSTEDGPAAPNLVGPLLGLGGFATLAVVGLGVVLRRSRSRNAADKHAAPEPSGQEEPRRP